MKANQSRFWTSNQKHILETDGNEVLISKNNRNKELTPKSGLKRMTENLRNVFVLLKDKRNNCFAKTSMSFNRSFKLIFRKQMKIKFKDSKLLEILQELKINMDSIEGKRNNEFLNKILTIL
jgi:hypothetical protein